MEAGDHLEQIAGGGVFVGEDVDTEAVGVSDLMIEARTDIGAAALLSAFEDEGSNPADALLLFLESGVNVPLDPVEYQRLDRSRLGPDL